MNILIRNRIYRAFTLVELLVVIAIVGILSGLIIVGMSSSVNSARIAKAQIFSASLRDSLLMSIISEWKFDDGSGASAVDSWNSGNNGTLTNFANTTAGYGDANTSGWMSSSNCISGTCLKFDGTDDYVVTGHNGIDNLTNTVTIEVWFNSNTYTVFSDPWQDHHVITYVTNSGNGLPDGLNTMDLQFYQNTFQARYCGSTYVYTVYSNTLDMNRWHHAAFVLDFPNLKLYIDGDLKNSGTVTYPLAISSGTKNVNIGRWNISITYFKGIIDTVRIYNAAMPMSRIKEEYYSGLNVLLSKGEIDRQEYKKNINE